MSITGFHVAIRAKNLEESIGFYEKLGAKVVCRDKSYKPDGTFSKLALVSLGSIRLELIEPADITTLDTLKKGFIDHFCIYVDDIEKTVEELKKEGIKFNTPTTNDLTLFGGLTNINLFGPAGELLEISQE